jgi:phosphoserine aminotransferase
MSLTRHPNRNVSSFTAGPSALPYEVLERAQQELLNYDGLESSVMELSHRSAAFSKIMHNTVESVRELLSVPDNYKIMFLQGGGNGQMSAVPMNLINFKPTKSADYFVTGYWSAKAYAECQKYGTANLVFPKLDKFNRIPSSSEWRLNKDSSYIFLCANETIDGVEFSEEIIDEIRAQVGPDVPIVADCSSNLFSKPIDISKYGVIFAGAQKNFGPAGVTCVIVRDDLLGNAIKECPTVMDYKIQSGNNSLYQTPPCYGIYMCGLVFEWLKKLGGMESFGKVNKTKSELIYNIIDQSNGFYRSAVQVNNRSRMTVPFRLYKNDEPSETLEKEFIAEAAKQNLKELKGHRSVGGIRAAIFNAISHEEVALLGEFMKKFQESNQ